MCVIDYNKIIRYNEVCFFIILEIYFKCKFIRVYVEYDNFNNYFLFYFI